jgi:hypothetical protein
VSHKKEVLALSLERIWKNASLSSASLPEDLYNGGNTRLGESIVWDSEVMPYRDLPKV